MLVVFYLDAADALRKATILASGASGQTPNRPGRYAALEGTDRNG